MNITIPTFNISEVFPDLDLSDVEGVNLTSLDPLNPINDINLKDFIDGDLTLNLDSLFYFMDNSNITKIEIPIVSALEVILNDTMIPNSISHKYTVIDSFNKGKGKFAETLGNVAIIDCRYANALLLNSYEQLYQSFLSSQPFLYPFLKEVDTSLRERIDKINLCDYALSIYGVLDNQIDAYVTTREEMDHNVGRAGNMLYQKLTLDSNVSISTPLKEQFA